MPFGRALHIDDLDAVGWSAVPAPPRLITLPFAEPAVLPVTRRRSLGDASPPSKGFDFERTAIAGVVADGLTCRIELPDAMVPPAKSVVLPTVPIPCRRPPVTPIAPPRTAVHGQRAALHRGGGRRSPRCCRSGSRLPLTKRQTGAAHERSPAKVSCALVSVSDFAPMLTTPFPP